MQDAIDRFSVVTAPAHISVKRIPIGLEKTRQRFLRAGPDPSQGLGFRRWEGEGGDAWGHSGFPGVIAAVIPELGASVALVTNRLHVSGEPAGTEDMRALALDAARHYCASTPLPGQPLNEADEAGELTVLPDGEVVPSNGAPST